MSKIIGKIDAAKTLFEIGKLAAETYETYIDGQKKKRDISKDREIGELKAENEKLKKKLKEKGIDID